jgi:2-hydroxy-3-keto-5-methylthiopentenyl-1-phosphate phosphatase
MQSKKKFYRAMVSSDWNECLAPCGPFDFIVFNYPELATELETVFEQYTGNIISLANAARKIQALLPSPITELQMDAYLERSFVTYNRVPDLIKWCLNNDILFMINTTGMIGYFQRIFAKGLLPKIPVLSANPLVRYDTLHSDPHYIHDLFEIKDKGTNTEATARAFNIPFNKIITMGDSGGDGPHFEWGASAGAVLIGSMTKPTLDTYCRKKDIKINFRFGISYMQGEMKDIEKEMQIDFMNLSSAIADFLMIL